MRIVENVSSIEELRSYIHRGWMYRGQGAAGWDLQTSLERCAAKNGVIGQDIIEFEKSLMREFRRAHHHYSQEAVSKERMVEWLAKMQHFGAPTRLLDFSYSIYVAAYFALERAESDSAVYCFHAPSILQKTKTLMMAVEEKRSIASVMHKPYDEDDEVNANTLFFEEPFVPSVSPVNPFRLNERLKVQQGVFLLPGDVSLTFENNLASLELNDHEAIKLILSKSMRQAAIRDLFTMSISRTTLFPGLAGYAETLNIYHPSYKPLDWESAKPS